MENNSQNQAMTGNNTPYNGNNKFDTTALSKMTVVELLKIAEQMKLEGLSGLRKQELIGKIMEAQAKQNGLV